MPLNEYMKSRQAHIENGRPEKEKKMYYIPKVSPKLAAKRAAAKEVRGEEPTDLQKWFTHFMGTSEPVCAECGMRADWLKEPQYEKVWRACHAHILPKKKNFGFPSLATNLDNHIVLFPSWGGHLCGDHGFYDSNWYNATTMKIWADVVKTFNEKLFAKIPEHEKKNIPEQFLNQLT